MASAAWVSRVFFFLLLFLLWLYNTEWWSPNVTPLTLNFPYHSIISPTSSPARQLLTFCYSPLYFVSWTDDVVQPLNFFLCKTLYVRRGNMGPGLWDQLATIKYVTLWIWHKKLEKKKKKADTQRRVDAAKRFRVNKTFSCFQVWTSHDLKLLKKHSTCFYEDVQWITFCGMFDNERPCLNPSRLSSHSLVWKNNSLAIQPLQYNLFYQQICFLGAKLHKRELCAHCLNLNGMQIHEVSGSLCLLDSLKLLFWPQNIPARINPPWLLGATSEGKDGTLNADRKKRTVRHSYWLFSRRNV